MNKFEDLLQKYSVALIKYTTRASGENIDNLVIARHELRDAIKEIQRRANDKDATKEIERLVQNLIEMRSDLNRKRIEELEKRNLGKTELKFEKSESGVVCVCQKCRNILPNKIGFFKCYQYCPVCGREIERLA